MKKDYFILFILIFYLFFQLSTLDYGFKINDIKYIKNISLNQTDIKAFTQKKFKYRKNAEDEFDTWQYRYKLYSINADEMLPIMALSKININEGKFDPQIYKYGGSFLYPLGFYYYLLIKTNLIENINISSITNNENLMDKIYFHGRLFILLTFIFSALILYKSLNLVTQKHFSLIFTMIYLFSPSSIIYSQIIKTNWFALLWFNLSIFYGLKYLIKEQKKKYLILVSIFLGLTIGSNILFLPSLLFLLIFIYLNNEKKNISKSDIINLIFVIFFTFFLTNPYILINFKNFIRESNNEYLWVFRGLDYKNIILFFQNSFIHGFGIIFSLTLFYFLLKDLIRSSKKKIIILYFLILLWGATISSFDNWHIQFKYIPYILPISLIYLSYKLKNKKLFCIIILISTILQTIPLKLAYYDENNPKYSTRLNAAEWVNKNIIDKKKSLCNKEFVPYDYPPVNFKKILIKDNCDYEIHVLRQSKRISWYEDSNRNIFKKFEPRFQFKEIPLVFGHINPLIIILKNPND